MKDLIYVSACYRSRKLHKNQILRLQDKKFNYIPSPILRKKQFYTYFNDRSGFFNNIINILNNKDSIAFIRNSLYYFYDKHVGLHQTMDVLNFTWLYDKKSMSKKKESGEISSVIALKYLYKGFLKRGLKRQCENKFLEVLHLLKLNLKRYNKSGFQLITFFFHFLKPLIGFRRKRLGRNSLKKKDIRFFYKLYHHN
jgi:hypothetical protein